MEARGPGRAQTVHAASSSSVTVPKPCSSEADIHDVTQPSGRKENHFLAGVLLLLRAGKES